jgi:hypothetical protein
VPPVYRPQAAPRPGVRASVPAPARPAAPGAPRQLQRQTAAAPPPAFRAGRPNVLQRIMAYRVEYPKSYKVNMDAKNVIVGFGNDDAYGISISFGKPDHSDHFVQERKSDQLEGLRVVSWEFKDDYYAALMAKATKRGPNGLTTKQRSLYEKIKTFPGPTWSDGANLDTYTKKNALSFNDKRWLPFLLKASKGQVATVDYPQPSELKATPAAAVTRAVHPDDEPGVAWIDEYPADTWPATRGEAKEQMANWRSA